MRKYALCALIGLCLATMAGAVEHPVSILGRVYIDRNCNGYIDSNDVLVNGVNISLQKLSGAVVGVAQTGEFGLTGVYAFPSDMAPIGPNTSTNYTLTILLPTGFKASNALPGPSSVKLSKSMLAFNLPETTSGTSLFYDFLICQTSPWVTYTQGGWGAPPHGGNPATFLSRNFVDVYGSDGVTIGGGFNLLFRSAKAIQDFLPQGGTPKTLTASAVDPKNKITVLAGQVLSVQLAVDFSDAGVTTAFLGDLQILFGPLAGRTVREALAIANQVLGGDLSALPPGVAVSQLNDVMTNINENFDGGDVNHHYLGW